jgi:hypothetical protein
VIEPLTHEEMSTLFRSGNREAYEDAILRQYGPGAAAEREQEQQREEREIAKIRERAAALLPPPAPGVSINELREAQRNTATGLIKALTKTFCNPVLERLKRLEERQGTLANASVVADLQGEVAQLKTLIEAQAKIISTLQQGSRRA